MAGRDGTKSPKDWRFQSRGLRAMARLRMRTWLGPGVGIGRGEMVRGARMAERKAAFWVVILGGTVVDGCCLVGVG